MDRHSKNTYLVTSKQAPKEPKNWMDVIKELPEDTDKEELPEDAEDVGDKKEKTPANLLDEFLEPFLVEKIGGGRRIKYEKDGAIWRREAGGGADQTVLYRHTDD
jgi:hypothetical protein